jgi:hypothetical protein
VFFAGEAAQRGCSRRWLGELLPCLLSPSSLSSCVSTLHLLAVVVVPSAPGCSPRLVSPHRSWFVPFVRRCPCPCHPRPCPPRRRLVLDVLIVVVLAVLVTSRSLSPCHSSGPCHPCGPRRSSPQATLEAGAGSGGTGAGS